MLLPIANCSMFCTYGVFHFLLLEKCKRYDPYVIVQDAGLRVDEEKILGIYTIFFWKLIVLILIICEKHEVQMHYDSVCHYKIAMSWKQFSGNQD